MRQSFSVKRKQEIFARVSSYKRLDEKVKKFLFLKEKLSYTMYNLKLEANTAGLTLKKFGKSVMMPSK